MGISMIKLLVPWPALLVEEEEKLLIASDFHLGIEYELAKMGINIPYQTERYTEELLGLVREHKPDRVVLLGDVKHGVPITSFQEKREIPWLFNMLLDEVDQVDVARGNHDGNIQNLAPEGVDIHPSRGFVMGDEYRIGLLHGHAWPYPELLDCDLLVMGHNHPTVRLNTPLGVRVSRRVWVRGIIDPINVAVAMLEQDGVKTEDPMEAFRERYGINVGASQVVIVPTFNDLMGGLPVNSETPKSLLGPLFRSGAVDVEDFDVYLLDGTFLGRVDFLRGLS
jgi:metallophosphoesterase superfamily enzyme